MFKNHVAISNEAYSYSMEGRKKSEQQHKLQMTLLRSTVGNGPLWVQTQVVLQYLKGNPNIHEQNYVHRRE